MDKPNLVRHLDYVRPGAERPIETRIIVEETEQGIRFIDPPGSRAVKAYYIHAGIGCAAAMAAFLWVCVAGSLSRQIVPALVSLIFAWKAKSDFDDAQLWATWPTIIELYRNTLKFTCPCETRRIEWPVSEIRIRSESPFFFGLRSFSVLEVVNADRRKTKLLICRPRAEVDWLADQIRQRIELINAKNSN
jgi:hypothetical protein